MLSGDSREGWDGYLVPDPRASNLWDEKRLGVVHAVGSPDNTRSHFDAQDYMESATPGVKSTSDGWLNRYLQARRHEDATPFRAVALTQQLPRVLQGTAPALAIGSQVRVNSTGQRYEVYFLFPLTAQQETLDVLPVTVTDANVLDRDPRRLITTGARPLVRSHDTRAEQREAAGPLLGRHRLAVAAVDALGDLAALDRLGYTGVVGLEGWASGDPVQAVERFRAALSVPTPPSGPA